MKLISLIVVIKVYFLNLFENIFQRNNIAKKKLNPKPNCFKYN